MRKLHQVVLSIYNRPLVVEVLCGLKKVLPILNGENYKRHGLLKGVFLWANMVVTTTVDCLLMMLF